jgi:hypothetical protein
VVGILVGAFVRLFTYILSPLVLVTAPRGAFRLVAVFWGVIAVCSTLRSAPRLRAIIPHRRHISRTRSGNGWTVGAIAPSGTARHK